VCNDEAETPVACVGSEGFHVGVLHNVSSETVDVCALAVLLHRHFTEYMEDGFHGPQKCAV
jgi:energy-converting hydrogenase Eha subunit A